MLTVLHTEILPEPGNRIIGILDTPMHPARYYAGFLRWHGSELLPTDNATCNYHRTYEEAEDRVNAIVKYMKSENYGDTVRIFNDIINAVNGRSNR